ncbi:alpha/beta hydrolase [Arthrobacter sulfonylureivorans]|uniref:alpha/beta hydrolase n=1 Tax=Arthrobacter sulfonylureivorans TaxID=2486855 RepID=UPI0039E3B64A
MATIRVGNNEVLLELDRMEKVAGLIGNQTFPLSSVTSVDVLADAFDGVRGLRSPGLAIPGMTRIGTWRGRGRTLAVARRGTPAVQLDLSGQKYARVVVSLSDAEDVAARIRAAAGLPAEQLVTEEEVRFTSGTVQLVGTWAKPAGTVRGAALILPGSGPIDRNADHKRMPLGISRDLARELADRGIASLRYDKRGTGASDGTFLAAGFRQNTDDAAAALRWMVAQKAGDLPVFLVGHSEGGYHAAAVAAEPGTRLDGTVLLSTSAHTGFETGRWQTAQICDSLPAFVRLLLKVLRKDLVTIQSKSVEKIRTTTEDVVRMQGRKINALWQREFIDFDPIPYLERLQMPVLAITGAKDVQVDPEDLNLIAATVPGPVTTRTIEDLSHLLRRDPKAPTLSDYKRQIREPVDAELLSLVGNWVAEQANAGASGTSDTQQLAR